MCERVSVLVSNDFHDELRVVAEDLVSLRAVTYIAEHERQMFHDCWEIIRPAQVRSRIQTIADLKNYRFPPLANKYGKGVSQANQFLSGCFYLVDALVRRIDKLETMPSCTVIPNSPLHQQWQILDDRIENCRFKIAGMQAEQGRFLLDWYATIANSRLKEVLGEIITSVPRPSFHYRAESYLGKAARETIRTRAFLTELLGRNCDLVVLRQQLDQRCLSRWQKILLKMLNIFI